MHVLYIFAGPTRRGDIKAWLQELAEIAKVPLVVKEVDILRDKTQNVLDDSFREQLLQ